MAYFSQKVLFLTENDLTIYHIYDIIKKEHYNTLLSTLCGHSQKLLNTLVISGYDYIGSPLACLCKRTSSISRTCPSERSRLCLPSTQ